MAPPTITRDHPDNLADLCLDRIRQDGAHSLRWSDFAATTLRWTPHYHGPGSLPRNDADLVRTAISNPDVSSAWQNVAETFITQGFRQAPNNSRGWVRHAAVSNFLPRDVFSVDGAGRLTRLPRGGEAEHIEMSLAKTQNFGIARYASQLIFEEQDLLDDTVGASVLVFEQLGAAAAALVQDLVFSLILRNPTLSDGVALFDATTHGNYVTGGGSALAQATLAAARAAIGARVLTDTDGRPATHMNMLGNILLVPPALEDTARRLAVASRLQDGRDFEVRSESRLSAAGVTDPETEDVRTAADTNWMLAADHSTWPAILLGSKHGTLAPHIRRFTLDAGQWGLGWDITLDAGAAAVDYRSLYFAAGA